jgi:enoyl-CoA hydratase/carnithine racemase
LNRIAEPEQLLVEALAWGREIAAGPSFAHAMTKRMLHQEWSMGVDEAIESEAQAQAICMMTQDFHRAYEAFAAKQKPAFQGD